MTTIEFLCFIKASNFLGLKMVACFLLKSSYEFTHIWDASNTSPGTAVTARKHSPSCHLRSCFLAFGCGERFWTHCCFFGCSLLQWWRARNHSQSSGWDLQAPGREWPQRLLRQSVLPRGLQGNLQRPFGGGNSKQRHSYPRGWQGQYRWGACVGAGFPKESLKCLSEMPHSSLPCMDLHSDSNISLSAGNIYIWVCTQ